MRDDNIGIVNLKYAPAIGNANKNIRNASTIVVIYLLSFMLTINSVNTITPFLILFQSLYPCRNMHSQPYGRHKSYSEHDEPFLHICYIM